MHRWRSKYNNKAIKEGWALFDHGTARAAIQRDDSPDDGRPPRFRTDSQAIEHVLKMAIAGSPLHIAAALAHLAGMLEREEA